MLIAQFDIPVREIDEMPPAFMLGCRKGDLHKWAPLGPLRFADKMHVRFLRQPIALARIARNARANHIFPCRRSASFAWHDMIEIQVVALKNVATILTGVLVTFEDIVTRELHFLFRETIEKEQYDHARHANLPRNRCDHFMFRRSRGKIAPALKIVRHEIIGFIRRNNVGMAGVYQRKRAPSRADIDRLPETIQHQNLTV
jgi:hypothetical protein